MSHDHLTWAGIGAAGHAVHAARTDYPPSRTMHLHDHAFGEVFWVESGRGWHHRMDRAEAEPLVPGSCLMVSPDLVHGFSGGDAGFRLANVAVPLVMWTALRRRSVPWPWEPTGGTDAPRLIHLGPAALHRLSSWLPELAPTAHPLAVESFLLDVLRLALDAGTTQTQLPLPVRQALGELLIAGQIPLGLDPAALARCTGWSIDHLSRELRRTVGDNATGLLNRLRLDHAERALRQIREPR